MPPFPVGRRLGWDLQGPFSKIFMAAVKSSLSPPTSNPSLDGDLLQPSMELSFQTGENYVSVCGIILSLPLDPFQNQIISEKKDSKVSWTAWCKVCR